MPSSLFQTLSHWKSRQKSLPQLTTAESAKQRHPADTHPAQAKRANGKKMRSQREFQQRIRKGGKYRNNAREVKRWNGRRTHPAAAVSPPRRPARPPPAGRDRCSSTARWPPYRVLYSRHNPSSNYVFSDLLLLSHFAHSSHTRFFQQFRDASARRRLYTFFLFVFCVRFHLSSFSHKHTTHAQRTQAHTHKHTHTHWLETFLGFFWRLARLHCCFHASCCSGRADLIFFCRFNLLIRWFCCAQYDSLRVGLVWLFAEVHRSLAHWR